ncbi:AMP forming long-chain acyl-CoA synthetase [Halomicronema hongdechloris C2206]|uniref:AMP forming long-chain acyl-CoA synthetase n=1 Tax=Halomicronema hongdechloris C2206 TaxID=1641165 RepID=A0A1Z3HJK8_9CYAN|nr:AMP-binding protein [Halomicronema hongdechloris]ASC70488.1 AMP forming long-chain acyl-CoA synthetase [Halomicronema hongdechloris C2206]
MVSVPTIYFASLPPGDLMKAMTLLDLLDRACDRTPHDQAIGHWQQGAWRFLSNQALRTAAEEVALGLHQVGLQRGDRVALVMHSHVDFAIADLGCLLAGVVDVPIDLTQTIENILFIVQHTEAKALIISDLDLLYQLLPYVWEAPSLQTVVVAQVPEPWGEVRRGLMAAGDGADIGPLPPPQACLQIPHFLCDSQGGQPCAAVPLPQCVSLYALKELRQWGRQTWSQQAVISLRQAIHPEDVATILYIASDGWRPHGVVLSHGNITANVLAAFSSYPDLRPGPDEVALLFLPLTHIFARVFLYGHLAYGHSIYLSDANHLLKHLRRVQPTILITVPRLLEKLHERILEAGTHLGRFDQAVLRWALGLGRRFQPGQSPQGLYRLQLQLATRLVFHRWRMLFGGRLRACICGGAALRPELTRLFSAAGVPVLQGYGLTEASGVLAYNRGPYQQAGTVGLPIPGAEVAIGADGEILVRGPFVMPGYYRDPEATGQVLEPDGWLHTGDLGSLSPEGLLTITGVKKARFKLSTGKYVSPQPLEAEMMRSQLVAHAIAVGANHKFCGMLIVPNWAVLADHAQEWDLDLSQPDRCRQSRLLGIYQRLIDAANCHLPYWSTVRRFRLLATELTRENGLLRPDGQVDRQAVWRHFATEIAELYGDQPMPEDQAGDEISTADASTLGAEPVRCMREHR